MCSWLIRQEQCRDNTLPSYLDQTMKVQTHSILRAGEAQQDYRGGLILTLKHPACSSYIIFSLPAVPLVSLSLLESLCWLPVSFYIKVQFLISSSRPHVALLELVPSFLSHPTHSLPPARPPSIFLQQWLHSFSPAVASPLSTTQPHSPPSCLPSGLIYCS